MNSTLKHEHSSNKILKQTMDLRPTTPRLTSLRRHNKLYRCPPTPSSEVQYDRERCFILDCRAVSNISKDYTTANPKLGSVIPPYIAQFDSHTNPYFASFAVKDALKKTGQV
jgi:hypothetical protein